MTPFPMFRGAHRSLRRRAARAGVVVALLAPPAGADWLMTMDGAEIETDGTWEVKGKLVVFNLVGGGLSSVRLSEVDLEASKRLTAEKARPPAVVERRADKQSQAVFVLRDEDVAHFNPEISSEEPLAAEAPATGGRESINAGEVDVSGWSHSFNEDTNGVELSGRVRNFSDKTATDVSLEILLYNNRGGLVGTGKARLETTVLTPKQEINFEASFPGILGFERPEFRLRSTSLMTTPPAAPHAGGSEQDESEEIE